MIATNSISTNTTTTTTTTNNEPLKSYSPISMNMLQPIIKSNIYYVDGIDEFEHIVLDINETRLGFDNNKACFYLRSRDKNGEYSPILVYFYEDFSSRFKRTDEDEFFKKCKELNFDEFKTDLAYKFFILNEKTSKVYKWMIDNKKGKLEYDTIKYMRWKMKKDFLRFLSKK